MVMDKLKWWVTGAFLFVAAVTLLSCTDIIYKSPSDNVQYWQEKIKQAEDTHQPIRIWESPGGEVLKTQQIIKDLNENHPRVRIRVEGKCASACTMLIAVKNLCYTKTSEWMFHGAATKSHPGTVSTWGNIQVMSMYPYKLQQVVEKYGLLKTPLKLYSMTGETIGQLDTQPRYCK